jgi:hypothetical protein
MKSRPTPEFGLPLRAFIVKIGRMKCRFIAVTLAAITTSLFTAIVAYYVLCQ